MTLNLTIQLANKKKEKPNFNHLVFGTHFTDHMFIMDYSDEEGWHDARIIPYQPITLDPSTMVFHYGQAVFEGLKAYYSEDGVLLFRPEKNFQRLNVSNERMCIPPVDVDFMVECLKELVYIEQDWIPTQEGASLYIRPFIIASEAALSVKPASKYKMMIILSPVGAYYSTGDQLSPVGIYVEEEYVRSVKGGVGFTKTSGNYAASLKGQMKAEQMGYEQTLWLDATEKKYVEEVGSMNIFFKIDDEIVTPALNGSILAGITRDSVITLLNHWGYQVNERKISIDEVYESHKNGTLQEVFGTGTAAVISPVGKLKYRDEELIINNNRTGELASKLYQSLSGIQRGTEEDPFGWTIKLTPQNK